MKWTRSVLLAFAIFSLSPAPILSAEANNYRTSLSLEELVGEVQSPEQLALFLKKNFQFEDDTALFGSEDYWQSPQEFWQRKTGDCEDYALLVQYVLQRLGVEVYVVSFYGQDNYAHTVAVYKTGNGYNVLNQDELSEYRAATVEEALTSIYPKWEWGAIAEPGNHRGWMVQPLFNHSDLRP